MKHWLLWAILISCTAALAQDNILEISNIRIGDIKYAGFTLNSGREVKITGEGAGVDVRKYKRKRDEEIVTKDMYAYAWILNAKTREMVWRMSVNNTDQKSNNSYARVYDDDVYLNAGEYEIYYSAQPHNFRFLEDSFFSLKNLFK